MPWLASLLVLMATLGNLGGYSLEQIAKDTLLKQVDSADRLEVRVLSRPNYQLVNGEVERVQFAARGVVRQPFRVAVAELETDPVSINFSGASIGLKNPLQAAVRLEVTEEDLNKTLNSPEVIKLFQNIRAEIPGFLGGSGQVQRITFSEPRIFLQEDRVEVLAKLGTPDQSNQTVEVRFRTKIQVDRGTTVRFVNPVFALDGTPVPTELTSLFLGGVNQLVDLNQLEQQNITARVLRLSIKPGKLELVGFAQVRKLP
jgi:LmeA-like phospholipid-binding